MDGIIPWITLNKINEVGAVFKAQMLRFTIKFGGHMRFGKIDYINLLPFHVFIKRYARNSRFNAYIRHKRTYPSEINRLFHARKIDAAFISSIAARGKKCTGIGIVARRDVRSVIVVPDKIHQSDVESSTSNVLTKILGISGQVLIGDKGLKAYLELGGANVIDLAEVWNKQYGTPFVFGRLCYNAHADFYQKLAETFVEKRVKIPHYILMRYAEKSGIPPKAITDYLKKISYRIDSKAEKGLKKFYTLAKKQRQDKKKHK